MITIKFKPRVLDVLAKEFPRSNVANLLEKYRIKLEELVNQNLSNRTRFDQLHHIYLLPISKLDHYVRITQKKYCLDKWLRNNCKLYKVESVGDVFKNEYSKVKFSHHVEIINSLEMDIKMIINEKNDKEISEFQLKRLLNDSNEKLFEYLFPTYKINEDNDQYDLLRVDRNSLSNYIVWLKEKSHYNENIKKSILQEATTILKCSDVLISNDNKHGYFPMARKANSHFGRFVYKGLSVHSMSKELRRAVIGNSYEYDMRSFSSVWRFGYAQQFCDRVINEIKKSQSIEEALAKTNLQTEEELEEYVNVWSNPKLLFETLFRYIGSGHDNDSGRSIRNQMFDEIAKTVFVDSNNIHIVVTEQERNRMYKIASDDKDLRKNIRETMFTLDEQRKIIKEVFTAIGFGADLNSNKWYKTSLSKWKPSALQSIISNDDTQNRIKSNPIIKKYIDEIDLLNQYIKSVELKRNPELAKMECLLVNGRLKDSKLFAYLFQQFETNVMSRFIELINQFETNVKLLARIHDAIIVDNKLKELLLIQNDLRKEFNNPFISFNKDYLQGWNQIVTDYKLNAEQEHKLFIQSQEKYAQEGYASLGIVFESKKPAIDQFIVQKQITNEFYDGTQDYIYDIDLDPFYDDMDPTELAIIKARRNSTRPEFIRQLL